MNLLIAFATPTLYDSSNLKKLNIDEKKLFLICPYDFIYFIFSLRNKILFKPFNFYRKETENYLKKEFTELKIKSLRPSILDIIYFLPISLINATKNIVKFIKILKGDNRSRIYSHGVEISGYCLDSMARFFGGKFRIEKENGIGNILSSFLYLLLLEIYTCWFVSKFNKKKINKVIINHNVYAESGLFGEFSQTLFGSKVCLVQRMFKDVIKIDNLKKDLFCYIPDFKSSGNEDKNFFWYSSNSITKQKDLASKDIDLSRVLVIMHTFADASHIHPVFEPLFISYYQWIKKTLEFARSMKDQNFIFRTHPFGLKFHPKDKFTLMKLFKNLPNNIKLEDSNLVEDSSYHFKKNIPIIVTYKGSITLEMGCSGINVVAMKLRTGNEFAIVPNSLKEYKEILEGKIDPNKFYLKKEQIIEYQKMEAKFKNFINPQDI